MKTRFIRMETGATPVLLWLALLATTPLHAQIVNDGATNTLSNVTTNITGDVTVGTNGSFTLLILSDNALLSNSVNGIIGRNATANSNEVRLTSSSARWRMGGFLFVGSNGASSRLVVSDGAFVENNNASLARSPTSSNNFALVTGAGSVWSNRNQLDIGGAGPANRMVVSNGGWVVSSTGILGRDTSSSNNLVLVTGSGSLWSNALNLSVGNLLPGNRLMIEAGGLVSCQSSSFGGSVNAINNEALVTGSGSLFSVGSFLTIGGVSGFNRLVVSNGAAVKSMFGLMGTISTAVSNQVVVTGAGSTWRNESGLLLGDESSGNRVEVSDGGWLVCSNAEIGDGIFANNNTVVLTGVGSGWSNLANLIVGDSGSGNALIASNGATVLAGNLFVGVNSSAISNSATVTGPGTAWLVASNLYVGSNGAFNLLVVSNGASVTDDIGLLSSPSGASNRVLVTGTGSIWNNRVGLVIGNQVGGSRLVVSNGGVVLNGFCSMGVNASSNNSVLVTGAGSVWSNALELRIGNFGVGNRVVIENGARLDSEDAFVGAFSANNEAVITGAGSVWSNRNELFVGFAGRGNRLVVSNAGSVHSTIRMSVGGLANSTNNRVVVDGGTLRATNATGTASLDVRRGTNVFNGGSIELDQLILTNVLGKFEFNGGTLVTRGAFIKNGPDFNVGTGGTPAVWDVRAGASNHFVAGGLYVGTDSSFNQLILTNGALLTNDGYASVGYLPAANSNSATLAGAGSRWRLSDGVILGEYGSGNRLVVSNGASLITDSISYLGFYFVSTNNEAVVTGPGSSWTSGPGEMFVGYGGRDNRLLVSDGGQLVSFAGTLGDLFANSSNNLAVVTGVGSLWSNATELHVGNGGAANRLVVSNGGQVACGKGVIGGQSPSSNNLAVVTGPGSVWSNAFYTFLGENGRGNQLIVSNGGLVTSGLDVQVSIGMETRSNNVTLTGTGSRWIVGRTLQFGYGGIFNRLSIEDGASLVSSNAQIAVLSTTEHNDAVMSGPGSSWTNLASLDIGVAGSANRLMVSNGACLVSGAGMVGTLPSATANSVVVSGANSRWLLQGDLYAGSNGAFNAVIVSDGAFVSSADGIMGFGPASIGNVGVVSGAGTVWNARETLGIGYSGSANRLELRDGARVESEFGILGLHSSSSNNEAVVTGPGSFWTNSGPFYVGVAGRGNRLVITNGGEVLSFDLILGSEVSSTNNRIVVDGGVLRALGSNAGLDIRRGTNVLNAGLIEAQQLRLTNTLGFFEFNGGTLITRGAAISNGAPFFVGRSGIPAIWDVRVGAGNHALANELLIGENASFCQLFVTNGAVLTSGEGSIGFGTNAHFNTATVSGAGSRWDMGSEDFDVGESGSGNALVVSNGGSVISGFADIGEDPGDTNNQVVVTGSNSVWHLRDGLRMGRAGAANRTLITEGGTVTVSNVLTVGAFPITSSNNLLLVATGALFVTNAAATGTLDIRGGTNRLNAGLIHVDRLRLTNTQGRFEFTGGKFSVGNSSVNNGQLFRVGNGVSPATFALNGNGAHSFANGLMVSANATLTGNGTISGILLMQTSGTLAPGASIGKMVLNNSPSLQGAVVMEISKNPDPSGLTNDQIQVIAPLAYGGSLIVSNLGPSALAAGDRFPLFSATSYSGGFTNISLPPLAAGLAWTNKMGFDGSIEVVGVSQPKIASIIVSGTNIIISGSNGPPNAFYAVLASTNVTLPLSNWVSLVTNQFDSSGNFSFTNAIVPGIPQRFYRIRTP